MSKASSKSSSKSSSSSDSDEDVKMQEPSPKHDNSVQNKGPPPFSVMVAVDDTDISRNAVSWAVRFAVKSGDDLCVVNAQFTPSGKTTQETVDDIAHSESLEVIQRFGKIVQKEAKDMKKELKIHLEIAASERETGYALKKVIRKYPPGLLVVGSRGLGMLQRHISGSVSDYCVHHCRVPVMVLKSNEKSESQIKLLKPLSKVLVGVDGSAHSHRMVDWLFSAATVSSFLRPMRERASDFELVFAHVGAGKEGFQVLNPFTSKAKDAGYEFNHKTKLISASKAGKGMLDFAAEMKADIVIIASRGQGQIKRQVLGSTSDFIVHNFDGPVIVYKDQLTNPKTYNNDDTVEEDIYLD